MRGALEPNAKRACGLVQVQGMACSMHATTQVEQGQHKSTKSSTSMYKIARYARNARDRREGGQVQPNACVFKHLADSCANRISRREYGTYEVKDHDLEQDLQEEVLRIQVRKHRDV